MLVCKFLITPTHSNDTGSDDARQPTASSQRQHALTPTARHFMVYIQHLDCFHKHPMKYIWRKKKSCFTAPQKKKKSIFFPSAALFFRVPRGTKQPSPQRTRAAVIRGRLGSHESSCQAEIASLFTHCFCPKLPFWVCD